jgi:hypothetical protein
MHFSLIYSNKIENTQWDNKLFLLLCFLTGWWFHNAKSKGFEYWFGGIDINATPEEETSSGILILNNQNKVLHLVRNRKMKGRM